MSDQPNKKHTPLTKEAAALATADNLMMDAIEAVPSITPTHVNSQTTAILIAAHAVTAKLDSLESTLIQVVNALREGRELFQSGSEELKFLAALQANWRKGHPKGTKKEFWEFIESLDKIDEL